MVNRILKRASTSGREDDDEDILKMRFQVFHKETKPVIDFYDSLGKVVRVSGVVLTYCILVYSYTYQYN